MHHVFEPREMRRGGAGWGRTEHAKGCLKKRKKEKKYHGSSAVLIAQKYNKIQPL